MYFAIVQVKIDRFERLHTAEAFGYVFHFQDLSTGLAHWHTFQSFLRGEVSPHPGRNHFFSISRCYSSNVFALHGGMLHPCCQETPA